MTTPMTVDTVAAEHSPERDRLSPGGPRRRRLEGFRPAPPTTWWPDISAAVGTVGASLWEIDRLSAYAPTWVVLMIVHLGLVTMAAATFRRAPALALVLVWLSFAVQIAVGSTVSHAAVVVLVVVLVAYGAARYGRVWTLWAAAGLLVASTSLTVHLVMSSPWRLQRVPFPLPTVTENIEGTLAGVVLAVLL